MTLIRTEYRSVSDIRYLKEMGFVVKEVKPLKYNAIGYLVEIWGKGATA